MSSASMHPNKDSNGRYFLRTQVWTKPTAPPSNTTAGGQTAIITGSNTGIGLEAANVLLGLKLSHLILAVRSVSKGDAAADTLRQAYPQANIEVWQLDMASLDIAILNAAFATLEFGTNTATSHEQMFQVNYLSTALLSVLLLPILKNKSPPQTPGRLTLVSSTLGLRAKFPNYNAVPLIPSFDDPEVFVGVGTENAYALSKTLVLILTFKLSELINADDVVVNAVGPALTGGSSELDRHYSRAMKLGLAALKAVAAHSPRQTAWLYVDGTITKGKESHGSIIINNEIYPFHPMMYTVEGKATMDRLWYETLEELDFASVKDIFVEI
ncbi:hypothetical protein V495_02082 [Pseudogymnoascus sp. VKM F-4514 (FW-929)]|nr:hypothetical protein V495_02082 [Pseudogymnoascus sp. VKM F-4514 (FW-929)]KFY66401.1 hypothetical protein V497_00944 [Pseudogymnoascus sp. VKM F-4516 (FW-969)]